MISKGLFAGSDKRFYRKVRIMPGKSQDYARELLQQ